MKREESTSYSCSEETNQPQVSQNKSVQNTEISSLRIIASQCVAILPIIFFKILIGTQYGFSTILIAEFSEKNSEIDVSLDELTWFNSYCFVGPVAAIIGGFIAQHTSIRRLLFVSYLLYMSAELIFYLAHSSAMILIAQVIIGFTNGIAQGSCFTYAAEIVLPNFRSTVMSTMTFSSLSVNFLIVLLGNFVYWRTLMLAVLFFSMIGFIFIPFMPDSPQWLAGKNRFEDAEKSLARLRGWTTPEAVKVELYSSISNASDSLSSKETMPGNDSQPGKSSKSKSMYLDRSFYIPLMIIICTSYFREFNATGPVADYAVLIYDEIGSPISGRTANIIYNALPIFSVFVYIFSVRLLGKRKLALASLFIISILLTVTIVFLYLTNNNQEAPEIYSWIMTIALITATFVTSCGIEKVAFHMNYELFPQKLRYTGSGIGMFIMGVQSDLIGKIFLYIADAITLPVTFIVFTINNTIGLIVLYFILPETEGVSLKKIEERYAGSKDLNNKNQQ